MFIWSFQKVVQKLLYRFVSVFVKLDVMLTLHAASNITLINNIRLFDEQRAFFLRNPNKSILNLHLKQKKIQNERKTKGEF